MGKLHLIILDFVSNNLVDFQKYLLEDVYETFQVVIRFSRLDYYCLPTNPNYHSIDFFSPSHDRR